MRTKQKPPCEALQCAALRRRIKPMHHHFNQGLWDKCVALVDPALKEQSKVQRSVYPKQLQVFKETHGSINPWHIRICIHLQSSSNKRDPRPFAYAYVVWQDASHGFDMFKERWISDSGHWFTRVAGLVANRHDSQHNND
jgi:hypothetical protein